MLQNQPRDWKDTFGARAGASFWSNPETELSAGAGYSSNAVPDETASFDLERRISAALREGSA